jgi:DNA end-binding protein Ku
MAARALWKAVLKIGGGALPVRMYSAVQEQTTHFHMLHAKDRERVHERMRRSDDDSIVERAEAHSGYTLDSGELVLMDRAEVKKLAPKPSRDISLLHVVAVGALPMAAYSRPYWLGPDGDEASYFALAEALRAAGQQAIMSWVLRDHQHFGALTEHEGRLQLVELHSSDRWLDSRGIKNPEAASANARELALAEQLIEGLDAPFDHASFHDHYREQVAELVQTKARGGKVKKARAVQPSAPNTSLRDALNQSLRALKHKTPVRGQAQERRSA